jgi:hypothetical protein
MEKDLRGDFDKPGKVYSVHSGVPKNCGWQKKKKYPGKTENRVLRMCLE